LQLSEPLRRHFERQVNPFMVVLIDLPMNRVDELAQRGKALRIAEINLELREE